MNEKSYYLFFDYDNTVSVGGSVPAENVQAMLAAQQAGHKLILNTGRSHGSYISYVASKIPIVWDGMMFAGADIRYGGRVLQQREISTEQFWKWILYAYRHKTEIVYGGVQYLKSFDFCKHPSLFNENLYDEIVAMQAENPQTKFLIYGTLDMSDIPKDDLTVIQMKTYADIFPTGCDKGSAIKQLCKFTGASLSQCVCFGDSENDIAMFEVCPTSICMKDSPKVLSDLATYHANGRYGVAEGLRWLLEQKSEKQP